MRAVLAALCLAGALTAVFWAGADAGARSERALRALATEPREGLPSALEAALSIPDAGARASALAAALREAGAGDLDSVFRSLRFTNLPVDAASFTIVFDWAASLDPEQALARAARLEHRDAFAAVPAVIRRWARQDPQQARRAVEKIEDPRGVDALWEALVIGWAERVGDPEVWAFVESMEMGVRRQKLIQTLVGRKLEFEGIEPVLRYVESISDDAPRRFKLQVFRRTARALARKDPARAVAFAKQYRDAPYGDGLLRKVASARVVNEGAPGFAWLAEVEAGPQRDEAVAEGYRRWLMADRRSALAWLREAPDHAAFDPARVLTVGATVRQDPAAAVEVLSRIQNPELQESAKLRLARIWLQRDRAAAADWIREAGFSPQLQAELLAGDGSGRAAVDPASGDLDGA